ncbi:hypothetical protein BST36_23450 [Mycolicibacterium moriokaense]|uniref:Acyl-CoA dehydrogenase n=1 Tax=Mycolicibacterium moriokaense TaxID=39691 RepID=A0AAD1HA22_9MYCO|nr:acyl-CoA dehydrogenase family protein [Mycolicibacterium moriokaense]MCV7039164.1 acyl-CoA/acyl-ACP dehydrogenase [Mycolicibacterium moriokaense]ORB18552.1 hypothetical protein BST36_23450 [Mycolicibacterium moriokaense]BBX00068.1 acyl-CoA dehydrogenase [Mycolicibacterium moriokaense]
MSEFAGELVGLIQNLAKDAGETTESAADEISPQWSQVQELGLVGIGIPEDLGGSGGELGDLVVVVRELAAHAIRTPIVEAAVAAFAAGVPEPGSFGSVVVDRTVASPGGTVTADLYGVPFATHAGELVIVGDLGLAVVSLSAAGVDVEPAIDIAGAPAGNVRLQRAAARPARQGSEPAAVVDRLGLLRSAALLGSASRAYELTRQYVQEREQFGAPLLKIPAVATALAQMAVHIGGLRSAVDRAISLCADGGVSPTRRFSAVASARIVGAQAATLVARSAHQLHGAVGVTQEYGLHRYSRSLWAWRDADEPERAWSNRLGAAARSLGEAELWDTLTA